MAALVVLLCGGCGSNIPSTPTVENTLLPSRFKVMSSDYCKIPNRASNFGLTVLSDTQGTNDLLVITTGNGVSVTLIPKQSK